MAADVPQLSPLTLNAQLSASHPSTSSKIASLIVEGIDNARSKQGLPTLKSDPALASIAERHSGDLMAHDAFGHDDASGCSPTCRLSEIDYPWLSMGENLFQISGYALSAQDAATRVVDGWLSDATYRENLLDPTFTSLGVGVAAEGTTLDVTADFAKTE